MSADFWIDLTIALAAFAAVIMALPQFRGRVIRRVKARFLRPRLIASLQRLIGLIAVSIEADEQLLAHRSDALQKASDELDAFLPSESVLYSDERKNLELFRMRLAPMMPDIKLGAPRSRELEDLILLGQRIVSDLRETST